MTATETFNFFLPLSKVEKKADGSCIVSGYASTPTLDLDGEIISREAIEKALPGYWTWRNIREMHQPSAVGVAQEANVDDTGLFLTSKITDKSAVQKVIDEVYKGYSIGGRKMAKTGNTITEIELIEISLVDRPANPECKISLAKSAKRLLKAATAGETNAGGYLLKAKNPPAARDGFSLPAKVMCKAHGIGDCDKCTCAMHKAVDCAECAKAAKAQGPKPTTFLVPGLNGNVDEPQLFESLEELAKRNFDTSQRRAAANSGDALPDGSFPIKNQSDLDNAVRLAGRGKNPKAAKAHIRAMAAKHGLKLPEKWSEKLARKAAKSQRRTIAKQLHAHYQSMPSEALAFGAELEAHPSFLSLTSPGGGPGSYRRGAAVLAKIGGEPRNDGSAAPGFLNLNKSMDVVGDLAYAFNTIRRSQRSLLMEGKREGKDSGDFALANSLGDISQQLAGIIGQKAEHEGREARDLSDADDLYLVNTFGEDFAMADDTDDLTKALVGLLNKARQPSKAQRLDIARGEMKKAKEMRKAAEGAVKAAHGILKAAYLAKEALIKAGKKPKDDDAGDEMGDLGKAMQHMQKAFGSLTTMKTVMKAATTQMKMAGRVSQGGGEVNDAEADYVVPPGVHPLSDEDLATAGPGTGQRGSVPPSYTDVGITHEYPGKTARPTKIKGPITPDVAALIERAARAEGRAEALEHLPAVVGTGSRPASFDTTKIFGDGGAGRENAAVLFKGVNAAALASQDENTRKKAEATVLGNLVTSGQFAKSVWDPSFRGAAAAGGSN
jgi:phage head maturation protease